MKERPILFSGPMVRAILEGRKTQTRRVIKAPWLSSVEVSSIGFTSATPPGHASVRGRFPSGEFGDKHIRCPYGVPGDRLWVKESAYISPKNFGDPDLQNAKDYEGDGRIVTYYADHGKSEAAESYGVRLRPSIHLPRWASRLTLEVDEVRVERLQAISEADAAAEGAGVLLSEFEQWDGDPDQYRKCFRELWTRINGAESYAANPWVWVVSFRRVEGEGK